MVQLEEEARKKGTMTLEDFEQVRQCDVDDMVQRQMQPH